MSSPWMPVTQLEPSQFAEVRQRTIFDCCKWDPQVEDVSVLCPFPLLISEETWSLLAATAEKLAVETEATEAELVRKTHLHKQLGLPRAIRKVLETNPDFQPPHAQKLLRFDFHFTTDGWKISEVNSDVPGGFIEASGFTALMAERFGRVTFTDPVEQLVQSIVEQTKPNATVALVHATAFVDDRQVMLFLARRLESKGLRPLLAAPDHIIWRDGHAYLEADWFSGPIDFLFRFYPAEWLPNLPRSSRWQHYFNGSKTPLCNPATALLTQSKRFPLIWDQLNTPLDTWRKYLPATYAPERHHLNERTRWVFKPALGRVGEFIGLNGATPDKEWKAIEKSVRTERDEWITQERFEVVPVVMNGAEYFPCLGVYTIGGRAAGIYGRISSNRLINYRAQDVAVLVEQKMITTPHPLTLAA